MSGQLFRWDNFACPTIAVAVKLPIGFDSTVGSAVKFAVGFVSTVRSTVVLAIRFDSAIVGN
jgi:hypothetical protein